MCMKAEIIIAGTVQAEIEKKQNLNFKGFNIEEKSRLKVIHVRNFEDT